MKTKICKKCDLEKDINDFRLKKDKCGKYYIYSYCKQCEKEYLDNNKEIKRKADKKYRENNKEKIKKYQDKRRQEMSFEEKEKRKKYYIEYRNKNKEQLNKKRRIYDKNKKEEDGIYKLKCQVRSMIKNSFRRKGYKKNKKSEIIYGCSIDELINHLIKTYENNYNEKWSWDYLANVHVDHIIPLANAKNKEEVLKLCHYTNLQLLKAKDNLEKHNKLNWELKK